MEKEDCKGDTYVTSPPRRPFPALLRRNGERLGLWGPPEPEAFEYESEEIEDDD